MKKIQFSPILFANTIWAVLWVGATTALMLLIGRDTLREAVIALLYLLPIGGSTTRWGQVPGIAAAIAAFLFFDFFFIMPYYTFNIGSIEGWLVLIIFLVVAIAIIGRIQYGLSQAQAREREAMFRYELSTALAGLSQQDDVARTLAKQLQQIFQAALVQVIIQAEVEPRSIMASVPSDAIAQGKPDRTVPILAARGMTGEICLWRGELPLPPIDDRLLQNFATQGALALERARLVHGNNHQ
jgi:two-component system sensor histidine kinase KdpD